MRRFTSLCLAAMLSTPLLAGGCARDADPAAAHDTAHTTKETAHVSAHDTAHDPKQDVATPAVRWPADEPLVRGMRRVRAATEALEQAGPVHSDAAQVRQLATELKSAVDGMFAECKLAPDADAAVHPLLARVLGASRRLSDGGFDPEALADLQAVLVRYGELFDETAVVMGTD